ncbi:MAG: FG-GAP-like repeat-containing protein [Bacteroidales bacterium]
MQLLSQYFFFIISFFLFSVATINGQEHSVISLEGITDVSSTGSALYSIPIVAIPGTKDLTPDISICYDSQEGNGILGKKWHLYGISSIKRMPQNLYNDDNITEISLDNSDRFYIDGNRLISVQGIYGGNGTIYKTEIKTFVTITSYGNNQNSPEYFKLIDDDGTVWEYGKTSLSRHMLGDKIYAWYIEKITDCDGNYMNFVYRHIDGEIYIDKIQYTGNIVNGTQPYVEMRFGYSDSDKINTKFIKGQKSVQSKLLEKISFYYDNSFVKSYNMFYNNDNSQQLDSIKLISENNKESTATKFEWGQEKQLAEIKIAELETYGYYIFNYDGDRCSDLFYCHPDLISPVPSHYRWQVVTNDCKGNLSNELFGVIDNYLFSFPADVTGDGKDEIIYAVRRPGNVDSLFYLLLGNNTYTTVNMNLSFQSGSTQIYTGDFDGDGKKDLMLYNPEQYPKIKFWGIECNTTELPISNYSEILLVNQNNNIKTDILISTGASSACYEYDNIEKIFKLICNDPSSFAPTVYSFRGDFNADGIEDVLTISKQSNNNYYECYVYINENKQDRLWSNFGTELQLELEYDVYTNQLKTAPLIGDINGDNKDDIIVPVKTQNGEIRLDIFYSDGYYNNTYIYHKDSIFVNELNSPNYVGIKRYDCTDMNGDGKMDILYSKNMNEKVIIFFHKDEQTDLVQKITDGFGFENVFDYAVSYTPNVYYTFNNESKIYLPIVEKMHKSNGIGNDYITTNFIYRDVLYSNKKKKFLGFSHIKATNSHNLISDSYYTYNTEFEYAYLHKRDSRYYNQGYRYRKEDVIDFETWNKVFLPYVKNSTITDFLSGTYKYITTTIDNNGRVKQIKTENKRIYNNIFLSSNTLDYSYIQINLPSGILLNKVREIKSTDRLSANNVAATSRMFYNYYNNGRIKEKIIRSNNGEYKLMYNGYNSFGLDTSVSKIATGVLPKTEIKRYDSYGRFTTYIKNDLDLITEYAYEPKYGNITEAYDYNNLATSYIYDDFGKEISVINPDGTSINTCRKWESLSDFPDIVYSITTTGTNIPKKIVYYDKLKREIISFVEGQGYVQTVYNSRGLITKKSHPFDNIYTSDDSKIWNTYQYDQNDRLEIEKGPYFHYRYAYSGNNAETSVITTSDLIRNVTSKKYFDLKNRLVKVEDPGGEILYNYKYKLINDSTRYVETILYGNMQTEIITDLNGNRIQISDPNAGIIRSTYDNFNRLTSQTDANGNKATYEYDLIDRVVSISYNSGADSKNSVQYAYKYDIAPGKAKGKIYFSTINGAIDELFSYDDLSRVRRKRKYINQVFYNETYEYNRNGQLYTITFPDLFKIKYLYNSFGEISSIYNYNNDSLICKISRNKYRKPSELIFGNKTGVRYNFNNVGLIIGIRSGNVTYNDIPTNSYSDNDRSSPTLPYTVGSQYRSLSYYYNNLGFIEKIEDNNNKLYETYTYDNIDRLIEYSVGKTIPYTSVTHSFTYDSKGNITNNFQVGTYYYYGSYPNRIAAIRESDQCPISKQAFNATYNHINMPSCIKEGDFEYNIEYGADGNKTSSTLFRTINGNTTTIQTKIYVSPYFEVEITPTETKYIKYIGTEQEIVAIAVGKYINANNKIYNLHSNHLGSFNLIMDLNNNIVQSSHFDPWGNRKQYTNWQTDYNPLYLLTDRGYTGHQHLEVFKIINTGARLYDPIVCNFLSPDPHMQASDNTQSYNRYSYCKNNPVNFIDPDGRDWVESKDGTVKWRDDVYLQISGNYSYVVGLQKGETYRGKTYRRFENISDKTYNDVIYNPDKSITSSTKERPDIDGVVTSDEALDWYHYGGGEPLTVDISKFEFKTSNLTVEDFTSRNKKALSVNFFNIFNTHMFSSKILYRPASDKTLSHVYGTIRLSLLDATTGEVRIVTKDNGSFDRYDFGVLAGIVAKTQRGYGNPKPFDFYGIGTGYIKLKK